MPHRKGKWTRPMVKVEVRPLPLGGEDWNIQTTTFGKYNTEVSARVTEAVRREMKALLAERKLEQAVMDIELPFNAHFRPWLARLIGKVFGRPKS